MKVSPQSKGAVVPVLSLIVATVMGVATLYNFYLDKKRLEDQNKQNIEKVVIEVWDLMGGNDGTIWIVADLVSSPVESGRLNMVLNKIETEVLQIDKNHKRGMELKAICLAKLGKFDHSIKLFDNILKSDPDYYLGYTNRGCVHLMYGKDEEALKDFKTALRINPNFARAYFNLGVTWHIKGDYNKAFSEYTKSIEKDERLFLAYYNRGKVSIEMNNYEGALSDFNEAIQINRLFKKAYLKRAKIWVINGHFQLAVKDLNAVLNIDPSNPDALNNMAWILATCPDNSVRNGFLAVKLALKSTNIEPDHSELDTLAAAYAEFGNFENAIRVQEKAITLLRIKHNPKLLREYEERLNAYKSKKPWREIFNNS